jgi:3D (Asp-Asp-Asp) domain-containing protein
MAMSPITKRLAFFIPLAASVPLWVGAMPQQPLTANAAECSSSQVQAVGSACMQPGFALAGPDGNETAPDDKPNVPSTIEDSAGPLVAVADPPPPSADASTPISVTGRPAVAEARRTQPTPMRVVRRSSPPARTIRMLVTGYCPCRECCGRWSAAHRTACGQSVYSNGSRFVAADTNVLPFGSRVSVPGYHGGAAVPVLDRGSLIVGRRLDVFFRSHAEAKRWGSRWLEVTVYRS